MPPRTRAAQLPEGEAEPGALALEGDEAGRAVGGGDAEGEQDQR